MNKTPKTDFCTSHQSYVKASRMHGTVSRYSGRQLSFGRKTLTPDVLTIPTGDPYAGIM